jgi:hypothetical protein
MTDQQILGQFATGRLEGLNVESFSLEDWDRLIATASSEGLSPLIYSSLLQAGKLQSQPESVRHRLSAAYAVTWLQNESLLKELEILNERCGRAGIPVVLLKGVCFALTIYPDIGLRPMGDMDILVPRDRLKEAAGFATTQGFTETLPEAAPGIDEMLSLHVRLQKPGPPPLTLEIHDGLVGGRLFTFAAPVDWFWRQTEPLAGAASERFPSAQMLTPSAQLLYAAAHAMLQHGGRGSPLRWFLDMHLLITHYSERLDWNLLVSQARTFEWSSALAAALLQTKACFNTPLPDHVTASLGQVSDRHQAMVRHRQAKPATRVLEEQERLSGMSWYGKARVLLALVVPAPAYMKWRYQLKSPASLPWAYAKRWWGIFVDGLRTLGVVVRR